MKENYFMGLDGFVWFVGVVESRNDPAKLGRVQVRCLGYHTEDLIELPTKDLPWAHVMHPVTDPSMQGLGSSPTFLVEGSWVVGFFRDANENNNQSLWVRCLVIHKMLQTKVLDSMTLTKNIRVQSHIQITHLKKVMYQDLHEVRMVRITSHYKIVELQDLQVYQLQPNLILQVYQQN